MALKYDLLALKTTEDCRTVMARLKVQGLIEDYKLVLNRYCDLAAQENESPNDPLIKDFAQVLAAYEQLLTEKNSRTTRASRTRMKIGNKGVIQSIVDWTLGKQETAGFRLLIEYGLFHLTAEFLVLKYGERFSEDVYIAAKARLLAFGVTQSQLDAAVFSEKENC